MPEGLDLMPRSYAFLISSLGTMREPGEPSRYASLAFGGLVSPVPVLAWRECWRAPVTTVSDGEVSGSETTFEVFDIFLIDKAMLAAVPSFHGKRVSTIAHHVLVPFVVVAEQVIDTCHRSTT